MLNQNFFFRWIAKLNSGNSFTFISLQDSVCKNRNNVSKQDIIRQVDVLGEMWANQMYNLKCWYLCK